jgi:hypothetical protein
MRKINEMLELCLLMDNDYVRIYEAIQDGQLPLTVEEIKTLRSKKTVAHGKHDDFESGEGGSRNMNKRRS